MSRWAAKHWSYTKWAKYDKCPLQADHHYNRKTKRAPMGAAAERGNKMHTWGENYLNGDAAPLPELERWQPRMDALVEHQAVAEEPWAFDRYWNPTAYTYRNPKGWLRMKLDAHVVQGSHMDVTDFKTGGIYPEHEDQAHLYATGTFHRYPEIETVDVVFMYWDRNKVERYEYSREKDAEHMTQTWETRYEEMMSETRFLPRPGRHCRICDFAKSKGGPCAYG